MAVRFENARVSVSSGMGARGDARDYDTQQKKGIR